MKILLFINEQSIEGKNLEAFFELDLEFPEFVVGEGPLKNKKKISLNNFLGYKYGKELAEIYSKAR